MSAKPGYTGQIARVDLSTGAVSHIPTENYAEDFIGGHGMAARIYWEEVPPQVQAFDPGNRLIFATGPCAGFNGLAGPRWVVCGKSPSTTPETFTHSNLGASWGAALKAAGFDALVVQGKADKPVYLLIQDGTIKIADARGLWGKGAVQVRQMLKDELGSAVKVVATGLAGDNMTAVATLLADGDASGSGGLGGVMGSKNLKAIAVHGSGRVSAAQPQRLEGLLQRVVELVKDAPRTGPLGRAAEVVQCTDCSHECHRGYYEAKDGTSGKFMCQSASTYKDWAAKYYGQANEVPFQANRLIDDYGINTKTIAPIIKWLYRCQREGLVTEKSTGLPLSKIGSLEFIQALTASIASRQGFGEVLAQGLHRAAPTLGRRAQELVLDDITIAGESLSYVPKAFITTGILYAVDSRQPIQHLHEIIWLAIEWVRWAKKEPNANLSSSVFRAIARRGWGGEVAGDFSTYEGKALAAKMIQERQLVKESLIVCDSVFPIHYSEHSPDHLGDPSMESQIFSAITGRETSEGELYRVGERVVNLQRAILAREGHRGREGDVLPEACFTVPLESERLNPDCLFPGKNGEILSKKGVLFDKGKFQEILGEFYQLRGWDRQTGLQKKAKLEELGLKDVARDLEARGLLS